MSKPVREVVSALIGAGKVNKLLGFEVYLTQDRLTALLEQCGVVPVGAGIRGPVWAEAAVVARVEAIQLAYRGVAAAAAVGVDSAALASVVERVLSASADTTIRQALERTVVPALDETDARLDKLQEAAQGLFRQQGANGQTLREVAQLCSTVVGEIRSGNAAVKKDVAAALAKFERQTEALMGSVRGELQGVRLSLNELAKRAG